MSMILTMIAAHAMAAMPQDKEVSLALEALPEHLRADAGVFLLTDAGFERHRESGNGYECLVERDNGNVLAPLCYDAVGAASLLPMTLMRAELRAAGHDEDTVRAKVDEAYAAGTLRAPSEPGMAYMLSPNFTATNEETGETSCAFPPHVMIYAPGKTNADFGIAPDKMGSRQSPFIINEGTPYAYVIMVDHSVEHQC